MANDLSLTILIGAAAGAAMSVFGSLKGTIEKVAAATKALKARQKELKEQMRDTAGLSQAEIDALNARFERQKRLLEELRRRTEELGASQRALAENEAARGQLRSKMMETVALGYLALKPAQAAMNFESSFADVKKVVEGT
jgi:predicted RNase H-like nuclease (RuvC/YqgF family)